MGTPPILHDFAEGLQVYGGVFGNTVKKQIDAGAAAFREHRADCVIGFGGGAALDVAKAVALMAVHEGSIREYAWDHPDVWPIMKPLVCRGVPGRVDIVATPRFTLKQSADFSTQTASRER